MKDKIKEWLIEHGVDIELNNSLNLTNMIHDCIQDLDMAGEWVSVDSITLNEGEGMRLHDAYEILRIHQKWRKGDQYLKQIPPSTLSEAIDMILNAHYSAEMTIAIPKGMTNGS